MQRKKAVIRCLAEMFGCRAGTLSKSSLFSHGPPNTRLQHPGRPKRGQRVVPLKNYFILGLCEANDQAHHTLGIVRTGSTAFGGNAEQRQNSDHL